ncbi:hypothetical protein LBW46_20105, partial [Ralstonia solanacearum]|uniref:hypothetical protein n=1 Tax=Ralstonia solanacearum TaxID=305 RepID=UPI002304D1BE
MPALQQPSRMTALCHGIRPPRRFRAVQRIDLLPQHRALQRSAGFARFLRRHALGKDAVAAPHGTGLLAGQPGISRRRARGRPVRQINYSTS